MVYHCIVRGYGQGIDLLGHSIRLIIWLRSFIGFLCVYLSGLFLVTISINSDIGVGNTLSAVKGSKVNVLTLSCVLLD